MADHRRLQQEVKERNSALFDDDSLSLDEALTVRKIIDHTEEELRIVNEQIILTADRAFHGYSHPGGINLLFYGYQPTTPIPRHPSGADSQSQA